MKTVGVLTSGGDAPGMNACLRAVVRTAIGAGMKVYGIRRGYYGLVYDDIFEMTQDSVSGIIQMGGTILYTARCTEFQTETGMKKAVATIKKYGIEGIIAIGGDGTFRGAKDLTKLGVPTVGIPGTIDNDLAYTDFTLGFDTAVNTCVKLINNLRDTMTSHERISIVEVMGRHCGDIALYAGVAGGAEVIIVPEMPYDSHRICEQMNSSKEKGRKSNIIVVAEGVGNSETLAKLIEQKVGIETRATIIGHIQRGGAPSMFDRILAARFGVYAVDLLKSNVAGRVVGLVDNKIADFDIIEALSVKRKFNTELYKVAGILSR